MSKMILVREWDSDVFHKRVIELEKSGFIAKRETYQIIPEMDPDNGKITHLCTIEMYKPEELSTNKQR
jgi:hypothetical protein